MLLTVKDLEKQFQFERRVIYGMMEKGLPFYRFGRNIRFKQEEVENYLESVKVVNK